MSDTVVVTDPAASARVESMAAESADAAAALAALQESLSGKSSPVVPETPQAEATPAPAADVPAVEPEAAKPAETTIPAQDAESAKLLARLNAMEAQLRAAQASSKEAAARLERMSAYEAAVEASKKGDIMKLAELGGWTAEMLAEAVTKGSADAVQPNLLAKRMDELNAQNEQLRQTIEREKAQRIVDEYKSSIVQQVVPALKDSAPHLVSYFTGEDGRVDQRAIADEVFAFQVAARNDASNPREVSAAEAAAALNAGLAAQLKRLMGGKQAPATTASPVAKPVATQTTSSVSGEVVQKPRVSPPPRLSQREQEERDREDALQALQAVLKGKA